MHLLRLLTAAGFALWSRLCFASQQPLPDCGPWKLPCKTSSARRPSVPLETYSQSNFQMPPCSLVYRFHRSVPFAASSLPLDSLADQCFRAGHRAFDGSG